MDNLHRSSPSKCPPVPFDEMAFAMALFVAAANGRLMPKVNHASSREIEVDCDPAVAGARPIAADSCEQLSCELPLVRAVGFIWQHYDQDDRRQAICSRLIAYYHLMSRNRGSAMEQAESFVSQRTHARLNPAMLEAIATAPLDAWGRFSEAHFSRVLPNSSDADDRRSFIASGWIKGPMSRSHKGLKTVPAMPCAQELALRLVAFEACIARPPGVVDFRVFEKLCMPFTTLGGRQGFLPFLLRALGPPLARFPWLGALRVTSEGKVTGLDIVNLGITEGEAAAGELAVTVSLVEILRSVLGYDVTVHLLRTVWPLAGLHHHAP